jgi:sugar-specific transcriptional regulator TrmB
MELILINSGLTQLQAQTYLYLLENGPSAPKSLLGHLKISRTNAYKVLESLEDLDLVTKEEIDKKLVYSPKDPSSLASLVAEKRNNIIALEQNVDRAIQQLRKSYAKQYKGVSIVAKSGSHSIIKAYEDQAELGQPIYFFKSRTDITFMGFEAMDRIRRLQAKKVTKRFGITPDTPEGAKNIKIDESTNLKRTWIDDKSYTAPVEWSVSDNQLLIQVFDDKGTAVVIKNNHIADAFRQIWDLSDEALRNNPSYSSKPLKAKRVI